MIYDAIIIGGGSAGLACAIKLSQKNINSICLIDENEYLGGILLQCIHDGFGLERFKEELTGPEYAERLIEDLNSNITIKNETTVLKITQDKKVFYVNPKEGYQVIAGRTIIVAVGCLERRWGQIQIPGDRPSGILTAGLAQRYLNIEGYHIGKRVFILGSGDIGLIMARRLTLSGATVLGVAEIGPYSNGLKRNIVQCLEDFNIPLHLSHTVTKVKGKKRLEKIILSKVDVSYNPIPGTENEIDCDTLLLSVGLIPDTRILKSISIKIDPKSKGPIVNQRLETNVPGIFVCGNGLHVHDLADKASYEGEIAADSAFHYLMHPSLENQNINVITGNDISYIVPQVISLQYDDDFHIFFRTKRPITNGILNIKQKHTILKSIKKDFLPSQMESVKIKRKDLSFDDLVIEVIS